MNMNEKIKDEHRQKMAYVYVRQSTFSQLKSNQESRRRQYSLVARAKEFGFPRVEVIDEDLGKSGASSANRAGFQRLVSQVALGCVGAIFCLEASRLARNNRDWHQLIDVCALVGTLIADEDGVYDPRTLNDRLLLGLKGTMSEFELGLLRQRSHLALKQKAKRGELYTTVPIGYVRTSKDRIELDPDQRIRQAIMAVFEQFRVHSSVRQTLLWCRAEKFKLPAKEYGPFGWTVIWKLPVYNTILKFLKNPIYAGAYVYGRTKTQTSLAEGGALKLKGKRVEIKDWEILILDHHPGYISWDEYLRNQQKIADNMNMGKGKAQGAPRGGPSLLAGLLRCQRCGRKLHVTYSGKGGRVVRYGCRGAMVNHGAGKCLSFGARKIDLEIERRILEVIKPAAILAAIKAEEMKDKEAAQKKEALELSLKQAQYEAERIFRQYNAIEPENRLVAAELERRYEQALLEVARLEDELKAFSLGQSYLGEKEKQSLLELAQDLPKVWNSPTTDMSLKKRIVRTLIQEIVVDVDEDRSTVEMALHWKGDQISQLSIKKNRTGKHRYSADKEVIELVRELARLSPDKDIARILNRLGYKTGKGNSFTQSRVTSLRNHHGIPCYQENGTDPNILNMQQAADRLGISAMTVRRLIEKGLLRAKQIVPYAPWMIPKEEIEREETKRYALAVKLGQKPPLTANLNQQNLDLLGIF
jgi:DNA invertase Pin-like site-specific DNA recombinase